MQRRAFRPKDPADPGFRHACGSRLTESREPLVTDGTRTARAPGQPPARGPTLAGWARHGAGRCGTEQAKPEKL